MKVIISIMATLLASAAVARPRAMEPGDPLPQISRITAFVVTEDGVPSVECWEISNIVDSMQVQQKGGSWGTARSLSLASSPDLAGVDIITWPSSSSIWPPGQDTVHADGFNLQHTFNLFSVQGGLISFHIDFNADVAGSDEDEDWPDHIFSGLENGDDWFYFEDSSSSAFRKANVQYPVQIATVSATETELMRLRYAQQPKHKVVHKGACRFTGIKIPNEETFHGAGTSRGHSPLTVQVNIEDSL